MELREGRTRGDSRVRPSYVPDVSGEGGFSASGIAPCGGAVQLEGKPRMAIADSLNGVGRNLEVGDAFGQ